MTKTICPNCKTPVTINGIGRKSYSIGFTIVCKALRDSKSIDGRPNYTKAAKYLSKKAGFQVSPGFAHNRITREAETRGVSRKILLADVMK